MAKLGIVIPVYNTEKYLRKCIESVLAQQYRDFELILVDDGSTDDSGAICDEYEIKDERVRVIHQYNQGMLKARYNGIKKLECEYLTTIDSDDWISVDTFDKLCFLMDQNYDVISFNIIRYFNDKTQIKTTEKYRKGGYIRSDIISDIFPSMIWDIENEGFGLDPSLCNKLFKSELFKKYLEKAADIGADYGQDVAVLYPLMLEADSLYFDAGFYYYHRQRKSGEIAGYIKDKEYYKKTYNLYSYLLSFFDKNPAFIKQIEFFYTQALESRLAQLYGEKTFKPMYLFPYESVKRGSKIILYGAGKVGKSYYDQIKKTEYCEVVAIIDSSEKEDFVEGVSILKPESLSSLNYDFIVIATIKMDFRSDILSILENMLIPKEKIV